MTEHLYRLFYQHRLHSVRGGWTAFRVLSRLFPLVSVHQETGSPRVWLDMRCANWQTANLLENPQPHEPHVQQFFRQCVHKTDVVIDIGANLGLHTVVLSQLAKRVIAFEPQPALLPALRRTIRGLPNVELHEVALSEANGTVPFYLAADHSLASVTTIRENTTRIDVPARKLDDLADTADFIKMDVEGWELPVLRGAEQLLRTSRPIVLYEDLSDDKPGQYLRSLGYLTATLHSAPEFPDWKDNVAYPPERRPRVEAALSTLRTSFPSTAHQHT